MYQPYINLLHFVQAKAILKRVDQIKPASIAEAHHFTLENVVYVNKLQATRKHRHVIIK